MSPCLRQDRTDAHVIWDRVLGTQGVPDSLRKHSAFLRVEHDLFLMNYHWAITMVSWPANSAKSPKKPRKLAALLHPILTDGMPVGSQGQPCCWVVRTK